MAVCIVVIALTLVAIDMKEDIFKRTSLISVGVLILAIASTIAASNPILGLIVNIITIFTVVYQTVDNYNMPMYFPFLLSYIFMLMSSPTTYKELPMRLLAMAIGCLYILLAQLVLNRGRFEKTISGAAKGIVFTLKSQIKNITEGKYDENLTVKVETLGNTVIKAINDNKSSKKYLSNRNKGIFEGVLGLERLNNLLSQYKDSTSLDERFKEDLTKVSEILDLVYEYTTKSSEENTIILDKINFHIETLSKNKENNKLVKILKDIVYYSDLSIVDNDEERIKNQSFIKNSIKKLNKGLFEFKFALKLSVSVSIVIFIVEIFNIKYGRWIIFPMIAILQPYFDDTIKKAKNRVIGTIIGIVLFIILFSIVKDPVYRVNLTIFTAYIGSFLTDYKYSTAIVAISALGSNATKGAEILGYRLAFAIIGCALALLINKFILHYRIEDAKRDLKEEHKNVDLEINNLSDGDERYNLLIKKKLIEHKIKY